MITDQDNAALTRDDQVLQASLQEEGFEVSPECWDSHTTSWESFDICIMRSCWDYHVRINEFLRWLEHLDRHHVKVMNPLPVIRWNYHKKYLKDLEQRGISIIPTYVAEGNGEAHLKEILTLFGWDEAVLKPCVSASSYRTYRVSRTDADTHQQEFENIVKESGALIQPFIREVQSSGEWSFIFFGGEFSHAVIKKPKQGEYRSQESFGGIVLSVDPTNSQIESALNAVKAVGGDLLYARVDMINVGGKSLLVELELIEPSLFFGVNPASTYRFVRALSRLA